MQTKYFISHLDTPLGYHLVECFRTDHLDIDNHSIIVGTANDQVHASVHQTINFAKHPQLACRAVLDCDVVILDLRSSSHEAETIIKFLSLLSQEPSKTIRIIGLSTLMTWQGCSSFEIQKDGAQKQKIIGSIINESEWRRKIWQDNQYKRRIPNNFYLKTYQLENLLLQLNKHKNIKSTILSTGIIYGCQNHQLSHEILKALNHKVLHLYGNGDNIINLTNLETLLKALTIILQKLTIGYLILKDNQTYTQLQIKTLIKAVTNNQRQFQKKEQLYLTKEQSYWNINLQVNSNPLFKDIVKSKEYNFEEYAENKLMKQFCEYNVYGLRQVKLVLQCFEAQVVDKIKMQFGQSYSVVEQADIQRVNQELMMKYNSTISEVVQSNLKKPANKIQTKNNLEQKSKDINFYKEALEILLLKKKYNNFILICNKQIQSIISQSLDLVNLSEIVPEDAEPKENSFIYQSSEYYQYFRLQQPKKATVLQFEEDKTEVLANDKYVPESAPKKDEKLVLLNQYLLDNVLTYVSEAKFRLRSSKQQLNLKNLISELKQIRQQQSSKNPNLNKKVASKSKASSKSIVTS